MNYSSQRAYDISRELYQQVGVDTQSALETLAAIQISLHCWQGDDVRGFENSASGLTGGIAVTGNYYGAARNADELRDDLNKAFSLIPGRHRLNLHAMYAELSGRVVERSDYAFEHFSSWVDWCASGGLGFDFNPTFFSHPLAADSFTLSSRDRHVREYWIAHGIACRKIAAKAASRLKSRAITNFWIPDGYKDQPADRRSPRERLSESLDTIFADPLDPELNEDSVESKLFGIGSESYVVGSHEFYLGYAVSRRKTYCLDSGHFHPSESVSDKVSSLLIFVPSLFFHVSRGVRWDSDHIVILDDTTRAIMEEIVAGGYLHRVRLGLDFFDASVNRIAAWVIGMRSAQKALLQALLLPSDRLRAAEESGDFTERIAMREYSKTLPFGAVWDEHCARQSVPSDRDWLGEVRAYERGVLSKRA
jgi:L-rhamnose isomerase